MTAPLSPGDAYAVPLFGDPIPTPQRLFASSAVPAPDPAPVLDRRCPGCGERLHLADVLCPFCRTAGHQAPTLQENR